MMIRLIDVMLGNHHSLILHIICLVGRCWVVVIVVNCVVDVINSVIIIVNNVIITIARKIIKVDILVV